MCPLLSFFLAIAALGQAPEDHDQITALCVATDRAVGMAPFALVGNRHGELILLTGNKEGFRSETVHDRPIVSVQLIEGVVITVGQDRQVCKTKLSELVDKKVTVERWLLKEHDKPTTAACVNAKAGLLVTTGFDRRINMYTLDKKHLRTLDFPKGLPRNIGFSPDGKHYFVCGFEMPLQVRLAKDGSLVATTEEGVFVDAFFVPEGDRILCCGVDGTIVMFDYQKSQVLNKGKTDRAVTCASVGKDFDVLVAGHTNGSLSFFDIAKMQPIRTLRPHTHSLAAVSVHEDVVFAIGADGPLLKGSLYQKEK
jgi:hypothetical protein